MKLHLNLSRVNQLKGIGKLVSILLLFLMSSSLSFSQITYPVSVNISVPGPSPMLADYTVPGRIIFNVNLNDLQIGSRDVKFKIKIESQGGGIPYSAISETNFFSDPHTLYSGVPLTLTGVDLAELFDKNNLNVTSGYKYSDDGVMPEGLYTIKLIAYDNELGYLLSNSEIGYATLFIAHLQPPFLTLPLNQSNIDIMGTQQLSTYFSWVPRNNGAPLGKEINYRLLIYPITIGQTPSTAINNTPIIIEELTTPFYNLQNSTVELVQAINTTTRDFAWRVQAYFVDPTYDPMFSNDGMSEVFTFTAYNPCLPPLLPEFDNSEPLQLTASWGEPSQTELVGYELHYREKSRWTSWNLEQLTIGNHSKVINNVKPDTYYEGLVRSTCSTSTVAGQPKIYYSDWVPFKDILTDSGTTSVEACIAPLDVQFTSTSTTLNISWTEGNIERENPVYTIEYKLRSATNWTVAKNNEVNTSYALDISAFAPGTYDFRVGSNCSDYTIAYSDIYTITIPTTATLTACNFPLPFDITVQVITGREQTRISWPSDSTNQVFKFLYRKRFDVGATWDSIYTGVNYVVIDSLDYQESYECKIEMTCAGGVTVTSPTRYFQLDDPTLTSGNGTNNSGDCFPPDYATARILVSHQDSLKIEFSWKAVTGAQSYKLKYENLDVPNSRDSVIVPAPQIKYVLDLLATNIGNTFEYTVQSRCDNKWSIPTLLNTIKVVIDTNVSTDCDSITVLAAQVGDTTMGSFKVRWTAVDDVSGYIIEYRPQAATTPAWYSMPFIPQPTSSNLVIGEVDKLDQDAVYEYRVKTICGTDYSEYTSTRTIRTLRDTDVNCGAAGDHIVLDTINLLAGLTTGDTIHANDFSLVVTNASGSNGVFTGEAVIEIKVWGSLTFTAEFTNATFNTSHQLIDGKIILKGVQMQYLPDNVRNVINNAISDINGAFDKLQEALDIIYDAGGIERKDPVGLSAYNPALVTTPGESAGTITVDKATGAIKNNASESGVSSGTTIALINKGEADNIKNSLPEKDPSGTILDNDPSKPSVVFSEHAQQKYGYDTYASGTGRLEEVYEKIGSTYIDWKSVGAGKIDRIDVAIDPNASASDLAKIKFISLAGVEYKLQDKNGQKFILVTGSLEGTVQEIFAWYADSNLTNKGVKLAKINVAAYKPKKNKVYMVLLRKSGNPSQLSAQAISGISTHLNDIYKSSALEWQVANYSKVIDLSSVEWDEENFVESTNSYQGDGLISSLGTDMLDAYTDEMENIIHHFASKEGIKASSDTYYLFYGIGADDIDVKGFLPRGRNIGFIFENFTNPTTSNRTVAHELGHGLTLSHTWEVDAKPAEGSTSNIMDYGSSNGLNLWKTQWEIVQYPKVVVAFLEDDEESQLIDISNMQALAAFKNSDGSITFLTPAGWPFAIKFDDLKSVSFNLDDLSQGTVSDPYRPNGTLYSFKLKDGKNYIAYRTGTVFNGYRPTASDPFYLDKYSKSLKNNTTSQKVCVGFPKIISAEMKFVIKKVAYDDNFFNPNDNWPTTDHTGSGNYTTDLDVLFGGNVTTLNIYERNNYTAEEKSFLGLNEGETNASILRAIKRVDAIILANPGLYNSYLGCNNQTVYGFTMHKSLYQSHESEYIDYLTHTTNGLCKKLTDYKAGLTKNSATTWKSQLSQILAKGVKNVTQGELFVHFYKSDCLDQDVKTLYTSLSWTQRLACLQIFSSSCIGANAWAAQDEQIIIDLIKFMPSNQQYPLLDALVKRKNGSDDKLLMQAMLDEWTLCGLNDKHFIAFVVIIDQYAKNTFSYLYQAEDVALQKAYGKDLRLDPGFIGWPNSLYIDDAGKVFMYVTGSSQKSFDPYEKVTLRFTGNKTVGSFRFVKGDSYSCTAIYAFMLMKTAKIDNWNVLGLTTVNVGLTVTGLNTISSGWSALTTAQKIVAGSDVAFGFAGILMDTKYRDELPSDIIVFWDLANLIGAGGLITADYITKASAALDAVTTLKATLNVTRDAEKLKVLNEVEILANNALKPNVSRIEFVKGLSSLVRFTKPYINTLRGFNDKIYSLCGAEGISLTTFKTLQPRTVGELKALGKLSVINDIRNGIPMPDEFTLMMKIIPTADVPKYISGEYQIRGYIAAAADGKHLLNSYYDLYHGFRLDYKLSDGVSQNFYENTNEFAVIFFKARNVNTAIIPRSADNVINGIPGGVSDGAPFTGTGLTAADQNKLSVPELKCTNYMDITAAEIYIGDANCNLTIQAIFDASTEAFLTQ